MTTDCREKGKVSNTQAETRIPSTFIPAATSSCLARLSWPCAGEKLELRVPYWIYSRRTGQDLSRIVYPVPNVMPETGGTEPLRLAEFVTL